MILIWIAYRSKIISDKQTQNMMFQKVIISTIILLAIDTALIFMEGSTGSVVFVLCWLLYAVYYILNGIVAYFWASYILYYIWGNSAKIGAFRITSYILLGIYFTLVLLSPIFQLIFYVQPQTNLAQKGVFFAVQLIVTYGLFTFSSSMAMLSLFIRKWQHAYYHKYVTLFSFVIFPLLGGILHIIFPEAKIVWQSLSLGFLLVYTEFQFDLISKDSLTGLNNRRAFDAKLKMIEDVSSIQDAYQSHIFILDINFFKDINDKFGHPEGDNALVRTANMLKHVLGSTNAFLSRYGGDEFAIIYSCTAEEAGALRVQFYKEFETLNQNNEYAYPISVSVGYAPIAGTGPIAVKNALKLADEELYSEKEFMHQALRQIQER